MAAIGTTTFCGAWESVVGLETGFSSNDGYECGKLLNIFTFIASVAECWESFRSFSNIHDELIGLFLR